MAELTNEKKKAIVTAYLDGEQTIAEIIQAFGINEKALYAILREEGVEPNRRPGRVAADISEAEVVDRYLSGEGGSSIADNLNVSHTTIYKILRGSGVGIRTPGRYRADIDLCDVVERNHGGEPIASIADDLGVSATTLHNRFKEAGIKIKKNYNPPRKDVPVEEIVKRYKGGESIWQIADDYPVSHETIRKRLIEAGVELRAWGGRGILRKTSNHSKDGEARVNDNGVRGLTQSEGP